VFEVIEPEAQLRALMCEWDPIGVMNDPDWSRDEYDCLVGPLPTRRASEASKEEIMRYLRRSPGAAEQWRSFGRRD